MSGCSTCHVDGPRELIPDTFEKVKIGMTFQELEQVLGKPDYSPTNGQYYYSTEGRCPLNGDTGMMVTCGYVIEFRKSGEEEVKSNIQSCSWGAIGE